MWVFRKQNKVVRLHSTFEKLIRRFRKGKSNIKIKFSLLPRRELEITGMDIHIENLLNVNVKPDSNEIQHICTKYFESNGWTMELLRYNTMRGSTTIEYVHDTHEWLLYSEKKTQYYANYRELKDKVLKKFADFDVKFDIDLANVSDDDYKELCDQN